MRAVGSVVLLILFLVCVAGSALAAPAELKAKTSHEVTFKVTSPDSPTVCVSWYETTSKQGPAKDFEKSNVITLENAPWTASTTTPKKVGHWRVAAWAASDCQSTQDPSGTVRCTVQVDGRTKARIKTKQIAF